MGIAAYNRGTKAMKQQFDREAKQRADAGYFSTHVITEPKPAPLPMFGPPAEKPIMGYCNITDSRMPEVGDRVFCTVSAVRGWSTVTAVKGTLRDLRIKTTASGKSWGYGNNFTYGPPAWMVS